MARIVAVIESQLNAEIAVQSNGLRCAYNVLLLLLHLGLHKDYLDVSTKRDACKMRKHFKRKRDGKEARRGKSSDNDCRNIAAKCFSICSGRDAMRRDSSENMQSSCADCATRGGK